MASTTQPGGYPIRAVEKLTGISIDTLRAWERRHGAVTPTRDDRGRIYSARDIARLRLLNQAISSGHSIGRIAGLSDAELRHLSTATAAPATAGPTLLPAIDTSRFNDAIRRLDSVAIDDEFSRLATVLPPLALVRDVLLPTLRDVGDSWNRRRGGIAHEHLISAMLRHLLGSMLRLYARRDASVRLLFATPSGDRHEIGILCAATLAVSQGFAVSYVGPDLPAAHILEAVGSSHARVLVLGLTLKVSGKQREHELGAVLAGLPRRVELWAGGPAVERYRRALGSRALVLTDLDQYVAQLHRLRDSAGRADMLVRSAAPHAGDR
jgi:DNA-binding transcriptional MerR regulator